ncbi:hypothetical protein LEMLEM_LOCUS4987 [Lemmus lemmus]
MRLASVQDLDNSLSEFVSLSLKKDY